MFNRVVFKVSHNILILILKTAAILFCAGFLFFGLAGKAWGATYYVSPAGTNTSPYDTWAKAANLPSTAITAGNTDIGGEGPHIMYIAPGTYVDNLTLTDVDWASGTFIGTVASGDTTQAPWSQVLAGNGAIISSSSGITVNITKNALTMKSLAFTQTGAPAFCFYLSSAVTSFTGNNIYIYSGASYGLSCSGVATFTNLKVSSCVDQNLYAGNAASRLTVNHGLISKGVVSGVRAENGAQITLNNVDVINNAGYGCDARAGSTINLVNSAVTGNGGVIITTPYYGLFAYGAGAVINYANTYVFGNNGIYSYNQAAGLGGVINDLGGNITDGLPYFRSWQNGNAYFCLTFDDDFQDQAYMQAVATATGVPITVFLIPSTGYTVGEITGWIAMMNAGHEMALHAYDHSDLSLTTAFAITTTNANPTVDVDVATSQLILVTTTGGNNVTVDWSTTDRTIAYLQAQVVGKGWTITPTTNIQTNLKLASLADTSGPQSVPYTCNLDVSAPDYAYWREEITDGFTWLANPTNIGSQSTTMAYPYTNYSSGLVTWLSGTSVTGARSGMNNSVLSSLNVFTVNNFSRLGMTSASTEAQFRQAARNLFVYAKSRGAIAVTYGHRESGEISATQWGYIADEIKKCGGTFYTFGQAIAAIRADHADGGGGLFTLNYPDLSDYHLQSSSPAIDTGTNVGLTSDYDGVSLPRGLGYEIGAYEYPVPVAPAIGTPSALSFSSIRWPFTDNSNDETGFRVYDNTNNVVSSSATANLSYLDETGLSCNTSYSGRYAKAYNSYGESAASANAPSQFTNSCPTYSSGGMIIIGPGGFYAPTIPPQIAQVPSKPSAPVSPVFTTDLKPGFIGKSVKQLQIFLNSDPDTQLAKSGLGSPGKETSLFGILTKASVIKFQEKYSKDILAPWNLTKGTGFVGKTTRAKINELMGK